MLTFPIFVPLGCCQEEPTGLPEVSLDKASDILGVAIPVPTYLPEGYEIRKVYLEENIVTLLISEEQDGADLQGKMKIDIAWNSSQTFESIKLPFEMVEIDNHTSGFIMQRKTRNELWWQWFPDPGDKGWFEFMISASKEVSKEELVKVARDMRRL